LDVASTADRMIRVKDGRVLSDERTGAQLAAAVGL